MKFFLVTESLIVRHLLLEF